MSVWALNSTLSVQAFYILLAIADRPLHGYGILDQVAHDSQGRLIMATGTVYKVLKRLAEDGMVERINPPDGKSQITFRYRITQRGRAALKSEVLRMDETVKQARYKLGERPFAA